MTPEQITYALISCLLMGISKSGLKGLGVLVVLFMAWAFEAKASTGILLPLLIGADVLAVGMYRKNVVWGTFFRLVPFMVIGVFIATLVGDRISEELFKRVMALIVVIGALLMLFMDRLNWSEMSIPRPVTVLIGLVIGFTTMLGNLAGPFTNLYFLAGNFSKDRYIATTAMLFFVINLFKVPFHIFVWDTINLESLKYDFYFFPVVLMGFAIGYRILRYFNNDTFRKYVIGMTIIGGIIMLLR